MSTFTHIWNPIGFPSFWYVEEVYMQRAMYVLKGWGAQDPVTTYGHSYDHPYFGQFFLAGVLKVIGYPDSILLSSLSFSSSDPHNNNNNNNNMILHIVNTLHLIPRLVIGILSVADTFLVYKIAERRYNRNIAFIAAVLFAVMPITWILRKVLLENILLPFLLCSVLFAVYYSRNEKDLKNNNSLVNSKNSSAMLLAVLISGIFLGLAIFTKLPAFTMIPLICYLIYTNNNKDLKIVALWFIPVIVIPLTWPASAILSGEFDLWLDDIVWQTQRQGGGEAGSEKTLLNSLNIFFQIDPVLFIIGGIAGLIYAEIKRDFLILLWAIPFLLLLFVVGFVQFFHLIPLIPVFCIAAARLIVEATALLRGIRISNNDKIIKIQRAITSSPFIMISAIGFFGLLCTTLLITTNMTSSYLQLYTSIIQLLPSVNGIDNAAANNYNIFDKDDDAIAEYVNNNNGSNDNNEKKVNIIGNLWTPAYFWIPKYVLNKDFDIIRLPSFVKISPKDEKILLILDAHVLYPSTIHDSYARAEYTEQIRMLNSSTYKIAVFREKPTSNYDKHMYPFVSTISENRGIPVTEVRANYELDN
ncbi:MAG: glycosyltransferase family 39 protein [Nitrososphaeraceae archaeon]